MEEADSPSGLFNGNKRLRRIKVYQVEAGREILQEAHHDISRILSSAIHAAKDQLTKVIATKNDAAGSFTQAIDVGKRVLSPSGSVAGTDIKGNGEMTPEIVRKESSCSSRDFRTNDERAKQSQRSERSEQSDHLDNQNRGVVPEATPIPSPREAWEKQPARRDKIGGPKKCLAEKKVQNRDKHLKRRQDLVRLKRAKRQQQQEQQEMERVVMQQEDRRSGDMERHIR